MPTEAEQVILRLCKKLYYYSPYSYLEYSISTPTFIWTGFIILKTFSNNNEGIRSFLAQGQRQFNTIIC